MTTNITADHRAAFEALVSGDYANFALFSCFVNGEPAAAIVAVTQEARGQEKVTPGPSAGDAKDGAAADPPATFTGEKTPP